MSDVLTGPSIQVKLNLMTPYLRHHTIRTSAFLILEYDIAVLVPDEILKAGVTSRDPSLGHAARGQREL